MKLSVGRLSSFAPIALIASNNVVSVSVSKKAFIAPKKRPWPKSFGVLPGSVVQKKAVPTATEICKAYHIAFSF